MNSIIGMAMISTSEITCDSLRLSPSMAPEVAMAADTPQIDTALEIIIRNSSSSPSRLVSQKVKYHTANTTTTDCRMPSPPALITSWNSTLQPSSTRPILMNSSVCMAGFSQAGTPSTLLISSPNNKLN